MLLLLFAMHTSDVPQEVNVNVNNCPICNVVKLFRGDPKARHNKAVGKLLANGDCAGAKKYALENGAFELADRVKAYCEPPPPKDSTTPANE
jgi:hypothetical protein